jgi:GTP cyclohydrolase I
MSHPPVDETDLAPASIENREKVRDIARHMHAIIERLGLDPSDPNLHETRERVARMYLEMFHGLSEGAEPKVTVFPNEERYTAMVMEKDIPFYSMCSHHFVPFYGHAHIAYIPNQSIVGLSKMARIVE